MRIVIKNADFSEVSIGKVVKDLSFEYSGQGVKNIPWLNVEDPSDALPWNAGTGGNASPTSFLMATSSAESYTSVSNNNNRFVSDFIEVSEGMVISTNFTSVDNTPFIVCYNASKEPLGPSSTYNLWCGATVVVDQNLIIPANVKYIKIQAGGIGEMSLSGVTFYFKGEMPE